MEKVTPIGNRALIKEDPKAEMSAGGIYIPPTASEQKLATKATVIAVGRGKYLPNGSLREPSIKAGDRIILGVYHGTEIKIDGEDYRIVDIDIIDGLLDED